MHEIFFATLVHEIDSGPLTKENSQLNDVSFT